MEKRPAPSAVLFDAYGTLFDVYSVGLTAEQLFPGAGDRLARAWRDKQIVDGCKKTGCSSEQLDAMLAQAHEADAAAEKARSEADQKGGLASITKAVPWLIGGALVVVFLPTLMAASQAGAAAIQARRPAALPAAPMQGITRHKRRRRAKMAW